MKAMPIIPIRCLYSFQSVNPNSPCECLIECSVVAGLKQHALFRSHLPVGSNWWPSSIMSTNTPSLLMTSPVWSEPKVPLFAQSLYSVLDCWGRRDGATGPESQEVKGAIYLACLIWLWFGADFDQRFESIQVPAASKVAIRGPTGAGKTDLD